MRRLVMLGVVTIVAALLVGVAPSGAQPPSPSDPAGRDGEVLGVVPARHLAGRSGGGGSNLVYHLGPVMRTNATYAIYWIPPGWSVSASYRALIDRFFADVAADGGKTTNVYYSTTQYSDTTGTVVYGSTFKGSIVDTTPFPASGCTDSVGATSVCLSDAQLRSEIDRVAQANGWPRNLSTAYFLFTPAGVGSCYSSGSCAFSQYCAYHSSFTSSAGGTVLYANQPYTATVPAACDAGQHPNGDDADPTINVVSHEHAEAITDPLGNAWYDRKGYENGDKCAWNFGTALGSTATGRYNQLINGNPYYLQQEWSNASSRCVLTGK
jgi:hypothetical protein